MALILNCVSRLEAAACRLPRLLHLVRNVPTQCSHRSLCCLERRKAYGFSYVELGKIVPRLGEPPGGCVVARFCTKANVKPDVKAGLQDDSRADLQRPQLKDEPDEPVKLNVFQRYKKMFKEYWYVMLPVHIATSIVWFGSFFYLATCGVDVVPLLEYVGLPETVISPLRKSGLGYIAAASAMYKLATPARYTVTLGATSVTIRLLVKRGLIKPMPSSDQLRQMLRDKMKPQ
ncbi:hypothetical protein ISCGN_000162 [Ixodes scapularis]|uniref:DUF1279 domain-containing protein n=1 Tax=Ixodes scapularis TaxID=6945 RepID=B7QHM7_IXOSC|nr:conserved hypothetical protein [Ixodes scapularis]|eukprot:XP_002414684.1 conserved hypothetical protein [Ixodes scapularis]